MSSPLHALERRLLQTVDRYRMIAPGDSVLVACSGGQDSVALLLALHRLSDHLGITLHAAHLNHQLRGVEAQGDAAFVADLCAGLSIPVHQGSADVQAHATGTHRSLEEAGREVRRAFLDQVAAEIGCHRIALGHTASDRAETLLMNILRGSGLDGLRSIPPVNGRRIRPLIDVSRPDTAAYCADRGIEPRQDATNLDPDACVRNRLRLDLLPALGRDYNPSVEAALLRLARAAESELDWVTEHARQVFNGLSMCHGSGIALEADRLAALPEALRRRVLQLAMAEAGGGVFEAVHLEALDRLLATGTGDAALPAGIMARLRAGVLVLGPAASELQESEPWEVTLPVPGEVSLPVGGHFAAALGPAPAAEQLRGAGPDVAFASSEAVGETLYVRGWLPGDRIAPLGMQGTRKLQDVFVDSKIPRERRHRQPVVVGATGEILWLPGLCLSRHAALAPDARRCAHLAWRAAR